MASVNDLEQKLDSVAMNSVLLSLLLQSWSVAMASMNDLEQNLDSVAMKSVLLSLFLFQSWNVAMSSVNDLEQKLDNVAMKSVLLSLLLLQSWDVAMVNTTTWSRSRRVVFTRIASYTLERCHRSCIQQTLNSVHADSTLTSLSLFQPWSVAMANADDLEQKLTCSICLQLFREPRLLPCGHTYCQHCLTSYITSRPPTTNPRGQQVQRQVKSSQVVLYSTDGKCACHT